MVVEHAGEKVYAERAKTDRPGCANTPENPVLTPPLDLDEKAGLSR